MNRIILGTMTGVLKIPLIQKLKKSAIEWYPACRYTCFDCFQKNSWKVANFGTHEGRRVNSSEQMTDVLMKVII